MKMELQINQVSLTMTTASEFIIMVPEQNTIIYADGMNQFYQVCFDHPHNVFDLLGRSQTFIFYGEDTETDMNSSVVYDNPELLPDKFKKLIKDVCFGKYKNLGIQFLSKDDTIKKGKVLGIDEFTLQFI